MRLWELLWWSVGTEGYHKPSWWSPSSHWLHRSLPSPLGVPPAPGCIKEELELADHRLLQVGLLQDILGVLQDSYLQGSYLQGSYLQGSYLQLISDNIKYEGSISIQQCSPGSFCFWNIFFFPWGFSYVENMSDVCTLYSPEILSFSLALLRGLLKESRYFLSVRRFL